MGASRSDFGRWTRLPTEALAACLCRGDAGADALLDQLALKLGNAGQHGRNHAPVRRREIEGHAIQRDHRHTPRLQLLQRRQQVGRAVVLRPQRDSSVTSTASISRRCAKTSTFRRSSRADFTPEPVSLKVPTTS